MTEVQVQLEGLDWSATCDVCGESWDTDELTRCEVCDARVCPMCCRAREDAERWRCPDCYDGEG